MTCARDLALVALDAPLDRWVEQGDLSLALAGAETIDLLERGALTLDDDRLVPGPEEATGDRLLDRAVAALVRREPYETVEDWLWRHGRGLAARYVEELENTGLAIRPRAHRFSLRSPRLVPADSPDRARAQKRWASGEPVLAALAAAAGVADDGETQGSADEAAATVLAAVADAVTELEATRQRRAIENAAFDNVWRA
ncbi:GPP34 family phosphoprotein [Streptomyces sp. NPDC051940]|uniref:GOLPH3/VPS74 family protein n=1 Tax=Streptomyces sp. NPDC051940 TaxID=3155675 RepID=UPI00341FD1B6